MYNSTASARAAQEERSIGAAAGAGTAGTALGGVGGRNPAAAFGPRPSGLGAVPSAPAPVPADLDTISTSADDRWSAGAAAPAGDRQGSALLDPERLQRAARAKWVSKAFALRLAAIQSPLVHSYRRTVTCADLVMQQGHHLQTARCRERWCLLCARQRTAIAIKRYAPILQQLPDLWMVTLSRPNVPSGDLRREIAELHAIWRAILDAARHRRARGADPPLDGIRKLECTYNSETNTYHPHFHTIISGRESAEYLRAQWLERNPTALGKAQDIRPAYDIIELFKYFTKLFSSKHPIPIEALDQIFRAVRRKRTWQPFGAVYDATRGMPDEEECDDPVDVADPQAQRILWQWEQAWADWVSITGQVLTGYRPSGRMRQIVREIGRDEHSSGDKIA